VIGFVQYFTGLPVGLVGAHMLGSCLVWLAALAVLWSTRERQPLAAATPATPLPPRTEAVSAAH
jgi:cytochrome c oxidase assembly protein subunit 15